MRLRFGMANPGSLYFYNCHGEKPLGWIFSTATRLEKLEGDGTTSIYPQHSLSQVSVMVEIFNDSQRSSPRRSGWGRKPIYIYIWREKQLVANDIPLSVSYRNFLGETIVRRVNCQPGVEVVISTNVKDEIQLSGNSLEGVSQSAADIQQICRVRNKDIRKV